MCNTAGQNSVNHDLKPSRIEKDEDSIQAIMDLLENNWANPFDNRNTEHVSLSSGAVLSESICNGQSKARRHSLSRGASECILESPGQPPQCMTA